MHFGDRPLGTPKCSKVFNHPAQRGGGGIRSVRWVGEKVVSFQTKYPGSYQEMRPTLKGLNQSPAKVYNTPEIKVAIELYLTRRGGGKGAGGGWCLRASGSTFCRNELFSPRGVTKFLRGRKFVTAECGDQLARSHQPPPAPFPRLGGSETRANPDCRLAARYPGSYQGRANPERVASDTLKSSEYPPRAHGPIHTNRRSETRPLQREFSLRDSFRRCGGAPPLVRRPRVHFPRSSLRQLRRHRGLFSVGLRIEHTQDSLPEFIVFWASVFFWTSGFQKLRTQLESLGYDIAA